MKHPSPPPLTPRELRLFDAGLSVEDARQVATGACPFCLKPAHLKMCPPLRAAMGDDGVDVEALIDSRDALLDRLAELEAV